MRRDSLRKMLLSALALGAVPGTAQAEMVLSKVIVDLQPEQRSSEDIEVWNDGADTLYVAAEPYQILEPGTVAQHREPARDPGASGILVSPQRLILEPGQRRIVRVAAVLPKTARDRVWRVTVKPVAGPLSSAGDALKLYVGYDVLVLQRPAVVTGEIGATRSGQTLRLSNRTNTAWEVFDGRQCDAAGANCKSLPATRLYAGAEWEVALPYATAVEYKVTNGRKTQIRRF
jgi:Mat/Ecp fimbriae periplasmic chaperone